MDLDLDHTIAHGALSNEVPIPPWEKERDGRRGEGRRDSPLRPPACSLYTECRGTIAASTFVYLYSFRASIFPNVPPVMAAGEKKKDRLPVGFAAGRTMSSISRSLRNRAIGESWTIAGYFDKIS